MAVSVVQQTSLIQSFTSPNTSFSVTNTPAPGDVLVLVFLPGDSSTTNLVTSITGCGATWTEHRPTLTGSPASTQDRPYIWVGTGGTASGGITIATASNNTLRGEVSLFHLSGVTDPGTVTMDTTWTGPVAGPVTLSGPTGPAQAGQFVITTGWGLGGGVASTWAWDTSVPPAGWTAEAFSAGTLGTSWGFFATSYRIPAETTATSHARAVAYSGTNTSARITVGQFVIGAAAPAAGSSSGALSGTLSKLTGSFSATHTPPPPAGTLAGTLPALTGSFQAEAPVSGPLDGTLSPLEGTFTASSGAAVETSTQYANLSGYNYHGESEVDYEPPVAPSPARVKPTPIQRVHQSLPVPTLVNGRPV